MKRRDFLAAGAVGGLCLAEGFGGGPAVKPTAQQLYWAWWGWEPADHYRRTGGTVGAVDVEGAGFPAWYDRLHSEPLVRKMTGLGVNLAVTHFFKGFGLRHEQAEQRRTAELVAAAHRHGMRVLGYCQSRSLYYETFLAEEPDVENWAQRDIDGKCRTWGGAYFRWAPCIECREFRDYMKRAIRVGLEEIGLDGLHFDNDYCEPCYCPRCEKAFRAWLTERYPDPRTSFGLQSFAHVRQPPPSAAGRVTDPLVKAWIRFRCERLGDYHRELAAHARQLRPGVLLLGNPAYPRGADGPSRRSVWPPLLGTHLDLLFAENGNVPGMSDGALISQVRAYKQSTAVGYRVVSTTWRKSRGETGLALPQDPAEIALQVSEATAFGGVPGTNWALRPDGPQGRVRGDVPALQAALGKYLAFARRTEALRSDAKPVRDVAVLQTFASMAYDTDNSAPLLYGAEESLIRGGLSWETVFDDLGRLEGFAVLVLAGQSHLSDEQCAAIEAFARGGGGLVIAGDNGSRNEHGRQRADDRLGRLAGPRVVRLDAGLVRAPYRGSSPERVPLPKGADRLTAAVRQAAAGRLTVQFRGANTTSMAAYRRVEGSLVAHLVDYASLDSPKAKSSLVLGDAHAVARRARLLTADAGEQDLAVAGRTIELPALPVYAVVVVE